MQNLKTLSTCFLSFGISMNDLECPIYSLRVQGNETGFFFFESKWKFFVLHDSCRCCVNPLVSRRQLTSLAILSASVTMLASRRCDASPLSCVMAAFHKIVQFSPVLASFFHFHLKYLQNTKTNIKSRKYTTKC